MLAFTALPTVTDAGATINAPAGVQVTVENASGQTITTNSDSITISLGANPAGASLAGTRTVTAVNGVATFANLSIGLAQNGYTLLASDTTAPTTSAAASPAFNVDALPMFNTLQSLGPGTGEYSDFSSLVRDSSGNLYGTASAGGADGYGVIYELSGTNNATYTTLLSFTGTAGAAPGEYPNAGLTIDSAGNLYGITSSGGTSNDGTLFELSANHKTFASLISFTGTTGNYLGAAPEGGLILDGNGDLFGTTNLGGTGGNVGYGGQGTIFELLANHTTFKSLFSFGTPNSVATGENPQGDLTLDSSGNLYGTTYDGGTNSYGTLFELAANHTSFTSLVSFTGTGNYLGEYPNGGLAIDSAGNLYGTTYAGGPSYDGTLFELAANHSGFTTLVSFTGTGSYPGAGTYSGVILDSSGNLYGTTSYGGASGVGNVYELAANHTTFTSLDSFIPPRDSVSGLFMNSALSLDGSGNLYGTTDAGGTYGIGEAFKIAGPNHTALAPLYSFNGGNGREPETNLVRDSSGNLYGTTSTGGLDNDGTIFELSAPNHSVYTTLVSFTGNSGSYPGATPGPLTLDGSGNLFGKTQYGGTAGSGTIFELAANHTTFTSLISFQYQGTYPGFNPTGGVVLDSSGNLYGTASVGGQSNDGTLFELSANHSSFSTLISFSGNSGSYPGSDPGGNLTIDASGNLYGATNFGGTNGDGTLFELAANHSGFTSLVSFSGNTGAFPGNQPVGGLVMDSSGNLYGADYSGGTYYAGTLFELAANRSFSTLVTFGAYPATSAYPTAGLTIDSAGDLYGTTSGGGQYGDGTVFELAANHMAFTTLISFTGNTGTFLGQSSGFDAGAGVIVDAGGNLYGATYAGGPWNQGTVFQLNPIDASLSVNFGSVTIAPPPAAGGGNDEYFPGIFAGSNARIDTTVSLSGATVLTANGLTLAGSTGNWIGTLDLTNNDLDVRYGAIATVFDQVRQGYNAAGGGNWNADGITSSTAAADTTHLTALGVIINDTGANTGPASGVPIYSFFDQASAGAGDILVKYTYYGDANLDGKVDGSDYSLIDNGYRHQLTGWFNGDFNYDGVVNGSDYTLIDNSFNRQTVSLNAQTAAPPAPVVPPAAQVFIASASIGSSVRIVPSNHATDLQRLATDTTAKDVEAEKPVRAARSTSPPHRMRTASGRKIGTVNFSDVKIDGCYFLGPSKADPLK